MWCDGSIQQRYVLTALLFTGLFVAYLERSCLSMAITQMVKPTDAVIKIDETVCAARDIESHVTNISIGTESTASAVWKMNLPLIYQCWVASLFFALGIGRCNIRVVIKRAGCYIGIILHWIHCNTCTDIVFDAEIRCQMRIWRWHSHVRCAVDDNSYHCAALWVFLEQFRYGFHLFFNMYAYALYNQLDPSVWFSFEYWWEAHKGRWYRRWHNCSPLGYQQSSAVFLLPSPYPAQRYGPLKY